MEQPIRILTPIQNLADKLETVGVAVSAAQAEIDQHSALVARERELQAHAEAGHLTAEQARELVAVAEKRRVSDHLTVGREKRLADAKQTEVAAALALLTELEREAQALADDADAAAAELIAYTLSPVARSWRVEDSNGAVRDRALYQASRCWCGVTEAEALLAEIQTASKQTWGSGHIPAEARRLVAENFMACDAVSQGIRRLRAAAEAARPLTAERLLAKAKGAKAKATLAAD